MELCTVVVVWQTEKPSPNMEASTTVPSRALPLRTEDNPLLIRAPLSQLICIISAARVVIFMLTTRQPELWTTSSTVRRNESAGGSVAALELNATARIVQTSSVVFIVVSFVGVFFAKCVAPANLKCAEMLSV